MNHDSIENFRSVYDYAQLPVVLKDESLTIVYANRAYAKMLGRHDSDLIGTDGHTAYCTVAVDDVMAQERVVLETGIEQTREFELRTESGSFRRLRATKRRIELGGRRYVFGVISDRDSC